MRILLTNDDGIGAAGLDTLRDIAAEISDDVWVVAPDTDQSGASHSLTLHEPLRCRRVADRIFSVRGTPTDCVIMGVRYLMKDQPPDLVLSGINIGQNMADDITYSGTVAGAIEGSLLGVPSIALSLALGEKGIEGIDWNTPLQYGPELIKDVLAAGWPDGVVLNMNFPDCAPDAVQGVSVTVQGQRDPGLLRIDDRTDTRGHAYYWIGYERRRSDPPEGTDLWAVYSGRISVTPLHLDFTHDKTCGRLRAALEASASTVGQKRRIAG